MKNEYVEQEHLYYQCISIIYTLQNVQVDTKQQFANSCVVIQTNMHIILFQPQFIHNVNQNLFFRRKKKPESVLFCLRTNIQLRVKHAFICIEQHTLKRISNQALLKYDSMRYIPSIYLKFGLQKENTCLCTKPSIRKQLLCSGFSCTTWNLSNSIEMY